MGDNILKKYSLGWYIYSTIVLVIALAACIYQNNSLIVVITTISGIIYVLLNAKVNKYGFVFGIINILLYGIILLNQKIYGGAIYNIVYGFPMLVYGYIIYSRDEKKKQIGIKTIDSKVRTWAIVILTIVIAITAYVLSLLNSNLVIIDSITIILGASGIYLASNKYKEQWIVWIIANTMNTIMWTILTIKNIENLPILVMWLVCLVNSIYGFFHWNKLNKEK